jgi:hypothetical protein
MSWFNSQGTSAIHLSTRVVLQFQISHRSIGKGDVILSLRNNERREGEERGGDLQPQAFGVAFNCCREIAEIEFSVSSVSLVLFNILLESDASWSWNNCLERAMRI